MDLMPSISLIPEQRTPSPAEASPQLQSPLEVSLSNSPGSLPIRAPPTSDSDIETTIKNNGTKKSNSSSSSSSSSSSDDSSESEGFVSGEDELESASERPIVANPDRETLELGMEDGDICVPLVRSSVVEGEIFHEPVVGSSNFSSPKTAIPIAQLSGDDDNIVANEGLVSAVEDDVSGVAGILGVGGFGKLGSVVGIPKVRVFWGGREEEESFLGRDSSVVEVLDSGSVVSGRGTDGFFESIGVAEDSKMFEGGGYTENPALVRKPEYGIAGSGEKEPTNSVEDSISAGVVQDRVFGVVEDPVDALVASKEETLPGRLNLDEDVNIVIEESSTIKMQELEGTELKDRVVEVKKSEVLGDDTVSVNPTAGGSVDDDKKPIDVIEKSSSLGSGIDQAIPIIEELVDSESVEADKRNSLDQGDSSVDSKQPWSSESVSVGNTENQEVSMTKEVELPVEKNVSLGTEFDQASLVEEPGGLELTEADTDVAKIEEHSSVDHSSFDKNLEPETNPVVETLKLGPRESKNNIVEVDKDDHLGSVSVSVDSVVNASVDGQYNEKNGDGVDESVSLNQHENGARLELATEPHADSGAELNDSMLKLADDGVNSESSSKIEGSDMILSVDSTTKSIEPTSAQDAKLQLLIAKESKHLENGDTCASSQGEGLEDSVSSKSHTPESVASSLTIDSEVKQKSKDEANPDPHEEEEDDDDEGSASDEDTEGRIFGSSETVKQIMEEFEQGAGAASYSGAESSQDHSQRIDGQIVTDSDEVDTDEEGEGKELFDSAALAALLKAGSDSGSITITSPDGSRLFSIERPAGLGSSIRSLKPAPRPNRPNAFAPSDLSVGEESENNLSDEEKKKLEKMQLIRVKFLRLVQRLGHSPEDSVAAQVLYRMVLASGRQTSQAFSLETAKRTAMQLEAEGKDDLDFSLNILVLGKTGVGKSATINSIFGEEKSLINAFEPATTAVKEIIGTVDGVKIRVFDTPGLRPSVMEQSFNQKVLLSIKKFTKKCPADIILYVDRLDTQTRDLNDLPLLRSITSILGSSIWRSAIVTLTHAASAPPDGPSGSPLSYEAFVAQRSHVVQHCIGQAVGDMRLMNPSLMNPVSLVENHPSCRKNREGQRVLPNGQSWKPQLLLLCYSMKILSEVSSMLKPQDPFDHRKLFGFRVRSPPLPYLLSLLLQSHAHPKLSPDQGGENGDSDIDLGDLSDSDQEEEDEYDQLPPFKPLRKSQVAKLSKEQRKAYFDEYDYRVKLLQKKQWREELKRLREIKKKGKDGQDDYDYMGEDVDQENGSPAAVPVPLPDMVLPPSFDGDNPAYRYRFLEPTSQLLARPVLDTHGWDHDCGYDGVNLEENLAIAGQFPAGVAIQITKDKKEFNIHLDSSVSAKHGENGSTMAGFDIQTIGKQLAYILRGETKFRNLKKNKTAAGISVSFLGENVATGVKIEDQIAIGKRLVLVGSTGAVRSQGDVAYGANLEARLKEKDYPIGQDQSTLGLSLMRWRGDLALGANLQSQFAIGRNSKMAVRVGLNNKLSGQITVRTSSSEQVQIALMGLLPIANAIFRSIWPAGETY